LNEKGCEFVSQTGAADQTRVYYDGRKEGRKDAIYSHD